MLLKRIMCLNPGAFMKKQKIKILTAHRFYEKNEFREVLKAALPAEFPIASVDTKFYKRNLRLP